MQGIVAGQQQLWMGLHLLLVVQDLQGALLGAQRWLHAIALRQRHHCTVSVRLLL